MSTTVYRRSRVYTGQTKVDRGYTRPLITDLVASSGTIGQGHYGSTTPNYTPTAPTLTVDLDSGIIWIYANSEWVNSGVKLAL